MSSSLLARRIISSSPLQNHHLVRLTPLFRLSLSTQIQQQHKEMPFVAQYLISSLGFPPDPALQISADKRFAQIKSLSRLQSVIQFLKEAGLSDAKIKSAISFYPGLLSHSVDKTLKPKLHQLAAAGFTGEILVELIRHNPFVFSYKNPIARLQFWRDFMGDSAFLKLIQKNGLLITRDVHKYITPRLNMLKDYGFSYKGIVKLITKNESRFLLSSLDNIGKKLKQTEELGISRESNMFTRGLRVIASNNGETIEKKLQLFQNMYGWLEEDVRFAFMKYPDILVKSEGRVKVVMDFLMNDAGFEPRSIARRPMLLGYSLEKRLVPRHHVLGILKTHGLKKNSNLLSACVISEKTFLKRFIVPHEKDVPGLAEVYAAACSGKVPH